MYSVFLFLLSFILKICRKMYNKNGQEKKLKMYHSSILAGVIRYMYVI